MSEHFDSHKDTSSGELLVHLQDAIHHNEPLEITFDNGNFVELSVHNMQTIISQKMVDELMECAESESTFMLFLSKLFSLEAPRAKHHP